VTGRPRQLIVDFLGEDTVGGGLVAKMRRYEWGNGYMVIYLALDAPVTYNAGPDAQHSPYVHAMTPSLEYLARVYAECRSACCPLSRLC
jgi:beta-carotene ketolase (CrtO type)